MEQFKSHNVTLEEPIRRFDEEALIFFDPDRMVLELVAHSGAEGRSPWKDSPVPLEHAIRGFYSVTITVEGYERTALLLTQGLGFRHVGETGNRFRYMVPLVPKELPNLSGIPVFISAGRLDPVVPQKETERLATLLRDCGSDVTLRWQDRGHALSSEEINEAKEWLAK